MKMKTVSKWLAFVMVALMFVTLMPMAVRPATAANPDTTDWIPDQMVSADTSRNDRNPSIATDSNRQLYVAYEHYNSTYSKYEIKVAKSTDGGTSWTVIHTKSDTYHNLYNPSIAVDPYYNYIYVVYEHARTSTNYDIWLERYVGGTWYTEWMDNDADDDRLPGITVEYDKFSNNYVYVAYERRESWYDIDIMFARSTNHGDTWTRSALIDTPADRVRQPSITYAEGYIYVAYNRENHIDLSRSTNRGYSWSYHYNVSSLTGCSEPSIVATHGGGVVMVALRMEKRHTVQLQH